MKNTIKLNKDIAIDLQKLIDSRLLVQANSGGGKSWLLRRILEQSHGKVQQIVIDLEGEFSTLREKYDYILAGKGGDVPANPKTAAILARKLLELGVSAIIDLYELKHYERKLFVKLFLEAMINAPKELWHNVLVVIDEAHIFAPEKGQSEAMEAVIDLATRGRKRGYCAVLATQRLSKLHKDAAAECNNKLVGRTGLDIDMKRASEELGFTSKEQYLSLRQLEPGEFFAFGTAISNEVKRVKIGEVSTTHPTTGSRMAALQTIPPTEKIKVVLKKLVDLPQEAQKEMNTVVDLKNEISDLRKKLTLAKKDNPIKPVAQIQRIQVPMVGKRSIDGLLKLEGGLRKIARPMKEYVLAMESNIGRLSNEIKKAQSLNASVGSRAREVSFGRVAAGRSILGERQSAAVPPHKFGFESRPALKQFQPVFQEENNLSDRPVQGGAMRMLKVLVSRYPVKLTKTQLGTFSKMKPRGGSFNTYLSLLRSKNLIEQEGDLFMASQEGIDFIGESPNPPQTPEEIIEMWKNNLQGGARKMFEVMVEVYPNAITKQELGDAVGMVYTGGSFNTYMSILRSNGLIEEGGGQIKAAEHLFN